MKIQYHSNNVQKGAGKLPVPLEQKLLLDGIIPSEIILSLEAAEDFGINSFTEGIPIKYSYCNRTINVTVNPRFKLYMFYK